MRTRNLLYLVMLTSLVLALMAGFTSKGAASSTNSKVQNKSTPGLAAREFKNVPKEKISESE